MAIRLRQIPRLLSCPEEPEKLHSLMESGRLEQTIEYFGQALAGTSMAIRTLAKFASTGFPQPLISSLWTGRRFGRSLHVWAGVFVSRRERTDSSCDLLATVCSVPPLVIQPDEIDFLCKQTRLSIHEAISDYSIPAGVA